MDYSTFIKIGSKHVFDRATGVIYEVIRKKDKVESFREVYKVTVLGKENATAVAIDKSVKIPAGVINKAIKILRNDMESKIGEMENER